MAISDCSHQAIWIKTLIKELGIKIRSILIYGDNQGSIFIASNAVQESHTKHIDIHYHYICKLVVAKEVDLQFVPGIQSQTFLGNLPENACMVDTPSTEHGGVLNK